MLRKYFSGVVRRNPAIFRPLWPYLFPFVGKTAVYQGTEYSDRASAFKTIFDDNKWGSEESVSGSGSTMESTEALRKKLPALVRKLGAKTLLDAPSGDFNWMSKVSFDSDVQYIGGDIVPSIVERNNKMFGSERRQFINLDITSDELPAADLWHCRHVLFHLSNDDVLRVLDNFARSNVRHLLADTAFFIKSNVDIRSGGFRLLNLCIPPFNMPKPTYKLWDITPPNPPNFLCLWSRQECIDAITRRTTA